MAVARQKMYTSYNDALLLGKEGKRNGIKTPKINGVKYTGLDLTGGGRNLFSPDGITHGASYYNFSKNKNKTFGKSKGSLKCKRKNKAAKSKPGKHTFQYDIPNEDNRKIFKNSKNSQTFSELPTNGNTRYQDFEDRKNWMDENELNRLIKHQEYITEHKYFDPFKYFSCEYMRDYKFYINNPKLDIIFKENPNLLDPGEIKVKIEKDFSLDLSLTEQDSLFETETQNISNELFSINEKIIAKSQQNEGGLKSKQVKSNIHQSMQSLKNKSLSNYCLMNNPKFLMKKIMPSPKNLKMAEGTQKEKLVGKGNLGMKTSKTNKEIKVSTDYDTKKADVKKCQIDLLVPKKRQKKVCNSVLTKSLKNSRSNSPSNPQNSYYLRLNLAQHPTMSDYRSDLKHFKTNQSSKTLKSLKNLKNSKSKNPHKQNSKINSMHKASKLTLNRSHSPSQIPLKSKNLNYDSFLEYLNETMKSTSTVSSKALKNHQITTLSKKDQFRLKQTINSAIMPSERKKFRKFQQNSYQSFGHCGEKSPGLKPKLELNPNPSGSGLALLKPEYGFSPMELAVGKTDKHKNNKNNNKFGLKSRDTSKNSKTKSSSKCKNKPKRKNKKKHNLDKENLKIKSPKPPNSAAMLCKRIKEDIKTFGSSKLSKYLKTCKEKGMKEKKNKKLDSYKLTSASKVGLKKMKPTKPKLIDTSSDYFGNRGGSMDVNYQLKAFLSSKGSVKRDLSQSNKSTKSRHNSVKQGTSFESPQNSQFGLNSQRNPYTKFKKFFF